MRSGLVFAAVVFASVSVLASQEPKKSDNDNKTITVTGCLDGNVLRVHPSGPGSYIERYRLHASKQLLKEMTKEHQNHVLEITGVVTDTGDTTHRGKTVQVGKKTTIYTGAKEVPQAPSGQNDPILDVLSYREQEALCKG